MTLPSSRRETNDHVTDQAIPSVPMTLRVEQGLLMAYGPDGDPVPPNLIKASVITDPEGQFPLETGALVSRQRVLEILEAQQQAALSTPPSDPWVEAMLGVAGSYEPTPSEFLENEPSSPMPPLPAQSARYLER